jgi:hypothetical protein
MFVVVMRFERASSALDWTGPLLERTWVRTDGREVASGRRVRTEEGDRGSWGLDGSAPPQSTRRRRLRRVAEGRVAWGRERSERTRSRTERRDSRSSQPSRASHSKLQSGIKEKKKKKKK